MTEQTRDWFTNNNERLPDEPIGLVPTSKAYDLPPDLDVVQVGDVVRVGKGKRRWTVKALWRPDIGGVLAHLTVDGYVNTTTEVGRLTVVERAGS